ncbi:MAG: Asp-tRNA(Asn)/Glu-tRNA(Gln) amidotransferase subunit GatA [Candidatus Comchoanobacterales bacterium]
MKLHTLSIKALNELLTSRKISVKECTDYFLDRVDAFDQDINAVVYQNKETISAQVSAAQKAIDSGTAGLLTGIPIMHKDIFCVQDEPLTCGSKILDGYISPYSATLVSRLNDAGAINIGRLNMDEFAMGSSNETSHHGPCRNPWDLNTVPGGSSGGSAAAVAARLVPLTTGTDTGGSIRQPASFCGVTGLKPSYGRISRFGMAAYASSLDQAGPFGASAEDCAAMLQVMAGHDTNDMTCSDVCVPDYIKGISQAPEKMTIGLPKEYFNGTLNASLQSLIDDAIDTLQQQGHHFIEVSLPNMEYAIPTYYTIAPCEASSNLARYDGIRYGFRSPHDDLTETYEKSREQGFGDEVKRRILLGSFSLSSGYSSDYYLKAKKVQEKIRLDYMKAFAKADVLLCPTAPSTAFKIGEKTNDPVSMYLSDIYTITVNLAGLPAISVPIGFVNQMPVGMQIIGDRFREERILRLAHHFQQLTDWHQAIPNQYQ